MAEPPPAAGVAGVDAYLAYLAEEFSLQPDEVPDEVPGVGAGMEAKAEADRKEREALRAVARAKDTEADATPTFRRGMRSGNKPREWATTELSFSAKDACR